VCRGLDGIWDLEADRSPRMLQRKLAVIHEHLPAGVAISLAVTTVLTFVLPVQPRPKTLLVWWLANVLVGCLRFTDCLAYRRQPWNPDRMARRRNAVVAGAAAQGLLWGLLGWFLFPSAPVDQLFLTMFAAGMAGGAIPFLAPFYLAHVVFVSPLLLPICLHLMAGPSAMQKTGGYLGLLYYLSMLFASASTCRWMTKALGSTFENQELVGRLRAANAGLEQEVAERTLSLSRANSQLRQEIQEKEQERLRAAQSDAKHLSLLQAINEGFGHVDENEVYLFANPAAEAIFGVPPGTLVGRSLKTFLDPAGVRRVLQETEQRRGGEVHRYTLPIIRADGQQRMLQVNAAPLFDDSAQFVGSSAVFEDITDRLQAESRQRELEGELHHAQKLESLGSLAGGIAHDMNNVLGAVQAMVQTLKLKHAADSGLLADLEIIDRASTRGRDLVKGLTNFVRKELEEPELLDLNELVREEMELLGRTTFQKMALRVDLQDPLPAVMGEKGALGGALMNLCVNALDAMDNKGTLTLRTRLLADGRVELAVEDVGRGMAPEVAARATEPFFTTKAIGQGTGLGLSMVYATVKAHGGSMDIQSEEGRGTTVRIRLPGARNAPGGAGKAADQDQRLRALRILQVDDDELILASVPLMLEHLGHAVSTAAGGQEALDRLANGLEVDLVLLDLNMPGMNGLETLAHLRQRHPDLPVLLATGYLDTATEAVLRRSGKAFGITKPFSLRDLDAAFRRMAAL
jgi:PAS domain S-box-containing protein